MSRVATALRRLLDACAAHEDVDAPVFEPVDRVPAPTLAGRRAEDDLTTTELFRGDDVPPVGASELDRATRARRLAEIYLERRRGRLRKQLVDDSA